MKKVAQGSDASAEIAALETEFDNMVLAADTLKAQLPEDELSHCSGNLDKLKSLGEYDKIALQLFLEKNADEPDQGVVDSLTSQLNRALGSLRSGKLVSEQTALAFIEEVIAYQVQPEAGFDVSSTFIAPGESVTFTSTCSLSATDLHWTFKGADVETSTEENPTVTYNNPKSIYYGKSLPLNQVISINQNGRVSGWINHKNYTGFVYTDLFKKIMSNGGYTTPVNQYPVGKSPFGVYDMAGNVWEWTSTQIIAANGAERGQKVYAIKGGSWYANPSSCKINMFGEGRKPNTGYNTVGFRVVAVKK